MTMGLGFILWSCLEPATAAAFVHPELSHNATRKKIKNQYKISTKFSNSVKMFFFLFLFWYLQHHPLNQFFLHAKSTRHPVYYLKISLQ